MVNITTLIETNPIMATVNQNITNHVGATLVVDPYINDSPTVDQNNMKGQPQGIAPTENPSQGIAPTKNP
jgi:hypothetical protein